VELTVLVGGSPTWIQWIQTPFKDKMTANCQVLAGDDASNLNEKEDNAASAARPDSGDISAGQGAAFARSQNSA
jgi:hypothetical protein